MVDYLFGIFQGRAAFKYARLDTTLTSTSKMTLKRDTTGAASITTATTTSGSPLSATKM